MGIVGLFLGRDLRDVGLDLLILTWGVDLDFGFVGLASGTC